MTKLTNLTLTEARDGLKSKTFSSKELTQAHVDEISARRELNAFITETTKQALGAAAAADDRIASGDIRPMEGLPIALKDLFCTKGIRTTAGSKMLENFVPQYESTVTQNLKDAGAISLGKLNMDEFAMGSANLTSYFGPTINPWKSQSAPDKELVPGGSSGGSTAAVAANLALAATASDTGGSIRQPAAFCGLVGIKPTYGLCSRYGMVAFASSLDQAGPVSRTVRDSAIMLQHMASFDEKDATSLNVELPDFEAALTRNISGLKVGLPKEYLENLPADIQRLVEQGIDWLKEHGAQIQEISLKMTKYALPAYYIIAPAEASSNLARYDGVRFAHRMPGATLDEMYENTRSDFGWEVKRRIMIGTDVLSAGYYDAYYLRAQKIRTLIKQDFDEAFKSVDVMLTPTTPTPAFAVDEKPTDPVTMYLNDIFTVTANMAGLPGISIPAGLSDDGLPLGLQLLGPKLSEAMLFRTAEVIENCAAFPQQVAALNQVPNAVKRANG